MLPPGYVAKIHNINHGLWRGSTITPMGTPHTESSSLTSNAFKKDCLAT